MEKDASLQDGQLVFVPVPELPKVLVVQGIERIIAGKEQGGLREHIFYYRNDIWQKIL